LWNDRKEKTRKDAAKPTFSKTTSAGRKSGNKKRKVKNAPSLRETKLTVLGSGGDDDRYLPKQRVHLKKKGKRGPEADRREWGHEEDIRS